MTNLSGMNARRIHQFMQEHFPSFDEAAMSWRNIADPHGPRLPEIEALLMGHIGDDEVVVEVHRRLGASLPTTQAASFIGQHIGEGYIRATNRKCSGFVVVAVNGAACGWHAGQHVSAPTRFAPPASHETTADD